MTLVDAAVAMSSMSTAKPDATDPMDISNQAPTNTMTNRLLPTPRFRRTSNISISQELLTDDIKEFGMDGLWDEADHREHHSLPDPDVPVSSSTHDNMMHQPLRTQSLPDAVTSSGPRRDSTSSIGLILSFIRDDDEQNENRRAQHNVQDEDMSSVTQWDIEPLDAETAPMQDMICSLIHGHNAASSDSQPTNLRG